MSGRKVLGDLLKEEIRKCDHSPDADHCPEEHHSPETELSILILQSMYQGEYGELKDTLQMLSDTDKEKINAKDSAGMTALHCAVAFSSVQAVILLLKYNANVNAKDLLGFTPLFLATGRYPNTDIAARLIEDGHASVDAVTATGATALHGSALQGNTECVKLLLDQGADPRTEDNDGTTPFELTKDTSIKEMLHDAIIRWDAKKETLNAVCSNCQKSANVNILKRCSQCHVTLYCSKDCQLQHWKLGGHKAHCSGFVIAKPLTTDDGTNPFHVSLYHVLGSQRKTVKMYERKPSDAPKRMEFLRNKKFIVKVQLPLDTQNRVMMVYNTDRTCEGFIHPSEKGYIQLASRIKKEGYLGIKAYFWAELLQGLEGRFKVFHGKAAPFQKW